jgi:hypothetical protein
MKTYGGVDIQIQVRGQPHSLAALPPGGKTPQYPPDRMLGGPQSQSEQHGEVKILDPTGTQIPNSRLFSL